LQAIKNSEEDDEGGNEKGVKRKKRKTLDCTPLFFQRGYSTSWNDVKKIEV
jgi:hypothetical protein